MDLFPVDHLRLARRGLTTTTRDGKEVRLLEAERTYDADLEEVWDAVTTAERIGRWLSPVGGDLKVGGRYQIEGNAGGTVLACDPPDRLSVTWEFGGHVSWVDVSLRPTDGGTLLQLSHSAPVDPAMWDDFGPGAVGMGWELAMLGLAGHLADPQAARPAPEELPDLRDFMTELSDAWAAASIEAGTDPEEARTAAARCLAAYTGEAAQGQGR
jgi:uncharacterized protein YndB with AHSA1/START domain